MKNNEKLEKSRKLHKFERPGESRKRLLTFLIIAIPIVVFAKLVSG